MVAGTNATVLIALRTALPIDRARSQVIGGAGRKSETSGVIIPHSRGASFLESRIGEHLALQQPRQLGDVRRNPPGFIAREQTGRRPAPRFILAMI